MLDIATTFGCQIMSSLWLLEIFGWPKGPAHALGRPLGLQNEERNSMDIREHIVHYIPKTMTYLTTFIDSSIFLEVAHSSVKMEFQNF